MSSFLYAKHNLITAITADTHTKQSRKKKTQGPEEEFKLLLLLPHHSCCSVLLSTTVTVSIANPTVLLFSWGKHKKIQAHIQFMKVS